MKTPEDCFLEIIKNVKLYRNNNIDSYKNITNNIIHYYKLRNFDTNYVYNGTIILEKDKDINSSLKMDYFFSNKRSYICIYTSNYDTDYNKLQYYTLMYSEKLFGKYNIDLFIYGLFK